MTKPDYAKLREEAGFNWSISTSYYALLGLTDTLIGRDYNLNPDVVIEVYRKGRPLLKELYPEAPAPAVVTPSVSYGHVNCLGAELHFPEVGEVAHSHLFADCSLAEAVAALKKPVDWAQAGMAPFFIQFREKLQKAFPDETVGFSFGLEGPITTAYELRGDMWFYDMLDEPELSREFLAAVTGSIVDYHGFLCDLDGRPAINPEGAGLCDDIASNVPARLFDEMVIPFWDQYYEGMTTGKRYAHVEDLRPDQLPFLEKARLWYYDPSISPLINPRIIRDRCRVPFGWRLGSFHYETMDCQDVGDWVFQAAADGASKVFTGIEAIMCRPHNVPKVKAFIEASKEAKQMFDAGATRADLGKNVSARGREKFWAHWPK